MVKIHTKPLSKKEWEFWNERLGYFIEEFESNIALTPDEILDRGDKDMFETYLMGIVKGMWSVHKFMEDRMVQDDEEQKTSGDPTMSVVPEIEGEQEKVDGRKGALSEKHIKSIRKGIKRSWRRRRKLEELTKKSTKGELVIHTTLPKIRKGTKTVSSAEVLEIMKTFDKRKYIQATDVYNKVKQIKTVKPSKEAKYRESVFNRLYFLRNTGKLRVINKGHKAYYQLSK